MIKQYFKRNKTSVVFDLATLFLFGSAGLQLEGLALRSFALLYFAYFIHVFASHLLRYWERERLEILFSKYEAEKMTMLTFINILSHELQNPKMEEIERLDIISKIVNFCDVVESDRWEEL